MVGAWRSLVAHTLGVRVVAGSNPAAPTNQFLNTVRHFSQFQFGSASAESADCGGFCGDPASKFAISSRSKVAIAFRRASARMWA